MLLVARRAINEQVLVAVIININNNRLQFFI